MKEQEWNCPQCNASLKPDDKSWVLAVLRAAPEGEVSVQEPGGWRSLSCGHKVEVMVDKYTDPNRPKFKLEPHP